MRHSMSALTFEILSKALTQALAEQSDTPPDTMARCTLGRDKVMILVEYPLDSAQAEPLAVSTLDWLEHHLRHQFDTSGLPEEAADLAASGEEVAVQLFLKHFSEAKPFTMRSFIWKVDDGFDDIFGDVSLGREAHESGSSAVDTSAGPVFHNPSQDPAPVETTLSETTAITSPSDLPLNDLPLNDLPLVDDIDEPVPSELDDEHLQLDLEPDLALDFGSQGFESAGMALEGVETQGSEAQDVEAQDVEAGDFQTDDLGVSVQSASVPDEDSLEVTSTPVPSDFELAPTTEPLLEDALVDTEAAFAAELAASVEEETYSKSLATDFSLPGESPAVTSSDLDLPTVDLSVSAAPEADVSNDFFTFGEPPTASETLSTADSDEMDLFDLKSTEPPSADAEDDFSALADTADDSLFVSEETASEGMPSEEMPSEASGHTTAAGHSDEGLGNEWSDSESADSESADSESVASSFADSSFADSEFADPEFADPLEAVVLTENVADEPTEDATVAETLFELDGHRMPELAEDLDREDLPAMNDELGLDFGLVAEQASSAHPSELASDSAMADETLVNETLVNEQQIDTDEILAEASSEPDEFFAESSRSEHEPFLEDDSLSDGLLSLPTVPAKRPAVHLDEEDSRGAGTSDVDEDALGLDDPLENVDTEPEAVVADEPLLDYEADSQDGSQHDLAGEGHPAKDYSEADYSEADYSEEAYEEENYEDDPVYYLDGEAEDAEPFEEVALVDDGEVQRQREQWQKQSKGNRWVFVGALGLLVLGLLGFVFTRPCTLDKCDRLQTAQAQGDEAIGNLRLDTSLEAVKASKAQLQASIRSLKPIPPWSSYHDEAAAILPEYEAQVSALDQVTKAQSTAYDAAVKSQNPPHSVATWNEIADDWLTATQLLEAVPTESPVRELANKKLVEYRSNRATILVRIDAESKAEVSLRQSQQAATKATNLAKRAGSLQDWEDSLAAWESAVDNLSQIPQGTKAHAEAQQILPGYLEQLEEVRDRTQQERRASRDLFQAKQFAADAQRAEGEEQWMLSSQAFKSAISKLKPIPTDTLAHVEAQVLLDFYTDAMNSAENNLRVALRFQPIEPEFFAACGSTTVQKCTYSMRGGKVRLNLFQGYDTVIDQSITPPDQRAGSALDAQYVSQSTQLLQVITLLSTQAQVPVELYDAQGAFLARYRPDLNGFVREQES